MAVLIALLVALGLVGSTEKVVDLTEAVAEQADWKIVESSDGGPIGTAPTPPSHKPVTIRLVQVLKNGKSLYFSIEVKNDRQVEVELPVSLSSSVLDKPGQVIRFRELLVGLGTPADDGIRFQYAPSIKPVTLFGSHSAPGTIAVLSPGEKITLRLKTELQGQESDNLRKLRARIFGEDVQLTPVRGGYIEARTWILSLAATSSAD